tara:strand:- start:2096 stop:2932 length:837 start_codon:yes stop_codon:yes gene_type:complete
MKHLTITLLTLLTSMGVWSEENRIKHYQSLLTECSSSQVAQLPFGYGALFYLNNLNTECLKTKFDAHHVKSNYSSVGGSPQFKTEINKIKEEDLFVNKRAAQALPGLGYMDNLLKITSIYSSICGEDCRPAYDFIYQNGQKFWYLFTNDSSSVVTLKVNDIGDPEIFLVTNSGSLTYYDNFLVNLHAKKVVKLGQGKFRFTEVDNNEVTYKRIDIKSYYNGGGAFWFDSKETYSFLSDTKEVKFLNVSGNCYSKETFVNKSGFRESVFEGMDEVCVRE